jgi:cell division protein FtsL
MSTIRNKRYNYLNFLLLVIAIHIFCACSSDSQSDQLSNIEKYIDTLPDSALSALKRIDITSTNNANNRALYALLRTKANYKVNIIDTNDSLISLAIDHYRQKSDKNRLMQCLYFNSIICANKQDYAKAIILAMQSKEIAIKRNENFWIGKNCTQIADIYDLNFSFKESFSNRLDAVVAYSKSGKPDFLKYAQLDLSIANANLKHYREAYNIADSLFKSEKTDSIFHKQCIKYLIWYDIEQGNYNRANDLLLKTKLYSTSALEPQFYAAIARMHYYLGDYNSCKNDIDLGYTKVTKEEEKLLLDAVYSRYLYQNNQFNEADSLLTDLFSNQHRIISDYLEQDIISTQRDYYSNIAITAEAKINNLYKIIIAIVSLCLVLYIYHIIRIKYKTLEIDSKMGEISYLSSKINNIVKNNQNLTQQIEELNSVIATEKYDRALQTKDIAKYFNERLTTINKLSNEYYEKAGTSSIKLSIFNEVEKELHRICSIDNIKDIETYINNYNDNIIYKLRNDMPQFSDQDIALLTLHFARFSPRAICLFLNLKLKTFYNRRRKLAIQIEGSNVANKVLYLSKL